MTQREIDAKVYEMKSYIADKFRDIQMQAQTLKNVEDETKALNTLTKISDFTGEIRRAYGSLEDMSHEDIEEEPEEDNSYNNCSSYDGYPFKENK